MYYSAEIIDEKNVITPTQPLKFEEILRKKGAVSSAIKSI